VNLLHLRIETKAVGGVRQPLRRHERRFYRRKRYIGPMKIPGWLGGGNNVAEAIEAYDLGLAAKYRGDWRESLAQNQRADKLRPGDEATLWNLGIAATALGDWEEARRAWRAYGIEVNDGPGAVVAASGRACVRLNPSGSAEVVWGDRIDPARIRILNVPLPSSDRRYGDVLINDGAPEGTRTSNGEEYPVFDELGMWKPSAYSTFEVELTMPGSMAMERLEEKCRENDMWVEDWGTMRSLCAACSRGNPGEHDCTSVPTGKNRFGFAAKSEERLRALLKEWKEEEEGIEVGNVTTALNAMSQ
jgi:hypothetical protein